MMRFKHDPDLTDLLFVLMLYGVLCLVIGIAISPALSSEAPLLSVISNAS